MEQYNSRNNDITTQYLREFNICLVAFSLKMDNKKSYIADSGSDVFSLGGVTVSLSCSTVGGASYPTGVLSCSEDSALVVAVVVVPPALVAMSMLSSQRG